MEKINDLHCALLHDKYAAIEPLARIGTWEQALDTGEVKWSDELYRILGFEVASLRPSLQSMLSRFTADAGRQIMKWIKSKGTSGQKLRIEAEMHPIHDKKKWILAEAEVVQADGAPARIIGYVQDITVKKEAEIRLSQNEHLFRSLFEDSAIATAMADSEGRLFKANKKMCSLMGYTLQELTQLTFKDITYSLDLDVSKEFFNKLMNNEITSYQIEKRYQRKNGSVFWGLLTISAVLDKEGKAAYMVGKILDIDEAKKATAKIINLNAQLEASNRQKDQIFSIIAHDLRSPVWAMQQLLELTISSEETLSKAEMVKRMLIMLKSTRNTYDLMEELLQWSASQLRRPEYNPVRLSVQFVMDEAIRSMAERARSKEIEVKCGECDDLYVWADYAMLKTILRNLIGNAIKFTGSKGKIVLSAKEENGLIEFTVADTGIGMKRADLQKIFNADIRFTTFGTGGEKGTGLGLDICRDLVLHHGGTIRAKSVLGKGSTFIFTIPKYIHKEKIRIMRPAGF